jgi:hypothetical protein
MPPVKLLNWLQKSIKSVEGMRIMAWYSDSWNS